MPTKLYSRSIFVHSSSTAVRQQMKGGCPQSVGVVFSCPVCRVGVTRSLEHIPTRYIVYMRSDWLGAMGYPDARWGRYSRHDLVPWAPSAGERQQAGYHNIHTRYTIVGPSTDTYSEGLNPCVSNCCRRKMIKRNSRCGRGPLLSLHHV